MTELAPNAILQRRILLFMEHEAVKNVSSLAQQLDAARPAVSRALSALRAAGLAQQSGRTWSLTTVGRQQAEQLRLGLPTRAEEAARSIARTLSAHQSVARAVNPTWLSNLTKTSRIATDVLARLPQVPKVAGADLIGELYRSSIIADANTAMASLPRAAAIGLGVQASLPAWDIITRDVRSQTLSPAALEALTGSRFQEELRATLAAIPTTFRDMSSLGAAQSDISTLATIPADASILSAATQQAMASFTDSLKLNASIVEQLPASGSIAASLMEEFGNSGLGLSSIMRDLRTVTSVLGATEISGGIDVAAASLLPNVAEIGRAFDVYHRSVVRELAEATDHVTRRPADIRVAIPAGTTAAFVGSVKEAVLLDYDVPSQDQSADASARWHERARQFGDLFAPFGARFQRKWEGAWMALDSDNPDRLSHAADSGVELLVQLLDELAPNSSFTPDEIKTHGVNGNPTRKMRVLKVLGQENASAADWAEAQANGVAAMHKRLERVHHDRSDHPCATEQEVAGLLMTVGGLLLFLTSFRSQ